MMFYTILQGAAIFIGVAALTMYFYKAPNEVTLTDCRLVVVDANYKTYWCAEGITMRRVE